MDLLSSVVGAYLVFVMELAILLCSWYKIIRIVSCGIVLTFRVKPRREKNQQGKISQPRSNYLISSIISFILWDTSFLQSNFLASKANPSTYISASQNKLFAHQIADAITITKSTCWAIFADLFVIKMSL